MEEEKKVSNWIEDEEKNLSTPSENFEKLPSPEFKEDKITVVNIDFSQPFRQWKDEARNKVKKIVPCVSVVEGTPQKCNWWVNVKNPIYREILKIGKDAKEKTAVEIKIMQIGKSDKTQYKIVNI